MSSDDFLERVVVRGAPIIVFILRIAGDHSKISLSTKNVLIECTATDLKKVKSMVCYIMCII